jgi:uncharacterized protein YeaO (DUF488 family)
LGAKKFLSDNSYGPAGHGFNEFQEKYQTVQELKKQDAELTADLQKVNAQLEVSKFVSHVAENNPSRSGKVLSFFVSSASLSHD